MNIMTVNQAWQVAEPRLRAILREVDDMLLLPLSLDDNSKLRSVRFTLRDALGEYNAHA